MKYFYLYLILVNIFAVFLTVHDKNAAVKHRWRVKEATLLLAAALGGAPAMYLTMLVISHKTRKAKFMVGIPVIFFIELAGVLLVLHYVFKVF